MEASPAGLPPHLAAARERAHAGARLALRSLALNALLAALKFAGGLFGHTYVLIADGAESLLDVFSSLLVWIGLQVAGRPPDRQHPFGHGRAEPLAAVGGAAVVFLTAGFVAWQAVRQILHPHGKPRAFTLALLAGIIVAKLWMSRTMSRQTARQAARSAALGSEAVHQWTDALTSAVAFVGIAVALLGGPATTGADSWAALFACVIVVFNGLGMISRASGEIMDEAPPPEVLARIRAIAAGVEGVRAVDKCRVRQSGTNHLVDIHVEVDGNLTVRRGHAIAHEVKDALLAAPFGVVDVSVHVEPAGEGARPGGNPPKCAQNDSNP